MEKAIAVVVSYNRAALLAECIKALRNQTIPPDAILVVNNGSTDNTENWLKQQKDIFFITQNNVGSSGGFNAGITWAYKHGYSWIWCMDDDGYPKEDALEILLQNEPAERSLLNCAVINKEDKKSFVWKTGKYKTIDEVNEAMIPNIGHPFNGTLIHRSIIEKVGTPNHRLFLWGDETEYYYRIIKTYNIPVYTVAKSIHYHPATAFSYKLDWDFPTSWKMYYYVRNRFVIHKAKFSNKGFALLNYVCFIAAFAGIILVYQKTNKLKKLNFIIWPVADAFRNNYDATPPVILNRLKQEDRTIFPLAIFAPVRYLWNVVFNPQPAIQQNATA
ncbi:MAG TPA: glycosyltransferase family 2 protein [Ferruginibacter sp.]|nr:glycosyltransferase family 2 protein [Ferruginibacter sp.]